MKNLVVGFSIFSLIILSAGAALFGAGIMAYSLYSGTNLLTGFIIFCLGSILFSSIVIAYMVSKILTSTTVMVDALENLVVNEIEKHTNINPFSALFNNVGGMPTISSIKIARMDEEGNMTSLDDQDQNLSGLEGIIKSLSVNPIVEKTLEEMTIEELNAELKKDLEGQGYERAAKIRDIIQGKTDNKI